MDPIPVVVVDAAAAAGWLGQPWGFWVQTGAFFISAVAAVAVIWHNGTLARRRATIDVVTHQKNDRELKDALSVILAYHRENKSLTPFIADKTGVEGQAIRLVLNNHEFVCLGIRTGAFDEKMFKRMQHYNYMRTWEACCAVVHEIRRMEKKDTIFQEFEWLATRWKRKPLKGDSR